VSSPGIFERAAHEIRGIFTKAEDITATSTADLVYFKACIEEGLRMHPPLVGTMPRVVPEGGATICGRFVPGKLSMGVNHWATYRSERNFKNADTFCFERWLRDEEYADDDRAALQPFSFGPRICVAKG
jgi:cytochrome P450